MKAGFILLFFSNFISENGNRACLGVKRSGESVNYRLDFFKSLFPVYLGRMVSLLGGIIHSINIRCCCQSPKFLAAPSLTRRVWCSPLIEIRDQ